MLLINDIYQVYIKSLYIFINSIINGFDILHLLFYNLK